VNTLIIDNFLSKKECNFLINFYKSNENKSVLFRDVYPIQLDENNFMVNFLVKKLETTSKLFNSKIDWFEIVKWPIGSYQDLHFDTASNKTTLSSIVYLNENFEGGQTYYEDNTTIQPIIGRALFFDGNFHKHGVKKVKKDIRYVIAAWYKKL
jgi:hypothetical protein